jgi:hypothetical protein
VAYVADAADGREVCVAPYPAMMPRHRISYGGGEPVWSRDGTVLYYRIGDRMLAVDLTYEPAFEADEPRELFRGHYDTALVGHQHVDVAADREHFLMIKHGELAGPSEVRVVLDWAAQFTPPVTDG